MVKRIALLLVFACPIAVFAGNYATCLIDKMPGSENEIFTSSVIAECSAEHTGTLYAIKKGSGLGFFGFKNAEACVQSKTKTTPNRRAAVMISRACGCLYTPATFNGEMCAYSTTLLWDQLFESKQ